MSNEYSEGKGSIPCKHDFAGIMVLGVIYARECRKCEAVLFEKDKIASLVQSWQLLNTLREVDTQDVHAFIRGYRKDDSRAFPEMDLKSVLHGINAMIKSKIER